jgi:hypothetical protein
MRSWICTRSGEAHIDCVFILRPYDKADPMTEEENKRKRPHLPPDQACDMCRKRKVKCIGFEVQGACDFCMRGNFLCTDEIGTKARVAKAAARERAKAAKRQARLARRKAGAPSLRDGIFHPLPPPSQQPLVTENIEWGDAVPHNSFLETPSVPGTGRGDPAFPDGAMDHWAAQMSSMSAVPSQYYSAGPPTIPLEWNPETNMFKTGPPTLPSAPEFNQTALQLTESDISSSQEAQSQIVTGPSLGSYYHSNAYAYDEFGNLVYRH